MISILKKESSARTANEIEFLKLGTESNKFFKEKVSTLDDPTAHDLICQNLYYEFVPAGQNVFEIGIAHYFRLSILISFYV